MQLLVFPSSSMMMARGHKPIEASLINGLHVSEDCQIVRCVCRFRTKQQQHPLYQADISRSSTKYWP